MIQLINPTNFRYALVYSTLSEKPIIINELQNQEGLLDCQLKFIQLLEKVTNGSKIIINKDGNSLQYFPGIITNNNERLFTFDCGVERSITYFLEPIILLALFGKFQLNLELQGITNDELDISIDSLMSCLLPLVKLSKLEGNFSIKVQKRGFRPNGGGSVIVSIPFNKFIKAINLQNFGFYKKIRGNAYGAKTAIQTLNRMVSKCREVLNEYIPDVWIYTSYSKGNEGGNSPGYGISLVAESTMGSIICADEIYELNKQADENTPEQIAEKCAIRLLDEVLFSGFVDSSVQSFFLSLMALSEKKVSFLKIGRLTNYSVEVLRLIRQFFGVTFKISQDDDKQFITDEIQKDKQNMEVEEEEKKQVDDEESDEQEQNEKLEEEAKSVAKYMIFSCIGIGLQNFSRVTD